MMVHDLIAFLSELHGSFRDDYRRIRARAREDPGTAGDRAEESWAELLRDWLPETYPVVTRGRILSSNGTTSPQIDILVLDPDYPRKLRSKKVFLSEGVVSALEVKLTLRSHHIESLFATAKAVKQLDPTHTLASRCPLDELRHRIQIGLLAHSFDSVDASVEGRRDKLGRVLAAQMRDVTHPATMPEFVCVADVGTFRLTRVIWPPQAAVHRWVGEAAQPSSYNENGFIEATYAAYGFSGDLVQDRQTGDDETAAVFGTMLLEMQPEGTPLAAALQNVDVDASGDIIASRLWPLDILSEQAQLSIQNTYTHAQGT